MCACVRLFLFDNCFVPLLEPHDFPTIFRLADWEGVFFFFSLFLLFFSSEDKLDTTISRESGPTVQISARSAVPNTDTKYPYWSGLD